MAFKFVAFCAFVAVAQAGVLTPVAYSQPIHYAQPAVIQKTLVAAPHVVTKQVEDYDHNPQYSFSYDIHDGLTGDAKSQTETRDGDSVKGQYSLIEADGTRRIVDYTADSVHGFNAVVTKEGQAHPEQKVVKVLQHQPVIAAKTIISQPAVYHSQPAVAYHSQPAVAYHSQPAVAYHAQPVAKTIISQPAVYHSQPAVYHSQPAQYVKHY